MISKNKFKYLSSLKIKKYRLKEQLFLADGFRLINEALSAEESGFPVSIQSIYYTKFFLNNKNIEGFFNKCENKKIKLIEADKKDIDKLSESQNNQGIIAVINIPNWSGASLLKEKSPKHQLILDEIADPGNLGNILRTAAWFGMSEIYLSKNSIDPYNEKVIRSAMGAHFYVNIAFVNIVEHIILLKKNNYSIIGADISGESLYDWHAPDRGAIILGNEAHGISSKVRKLIDYNITIPKQGKIESLNVSMAAGILLSHINKI